MLSLIDIAIILLFLVITLVIGVATRKKITLDDYWVNRRSTSTFVLFATLLSTSIGGATVVGVVSMGYTGGLIGAILGLSFALGLIMTSLFSPYLKKIGDKYNCYTLPDVLSIRYSRRCRMAGGFVNLIVFFFFMAAQFIAMGIFVKVLTNWSFTMSIIFGAVILLAYCYSGGLKSDFRTDVFQLFVMLTLPFLLLPIIVSKAGGFTHLFSLPSNYFSGTAFGGSLFIIGAFLFLAPSALVSMDIWQRVFAARNESTARKAFMLSAIFIIPFFVTFSLIGMFSKILFPNINPDIISAYVTMSLLPSGIKGLILSGFFAAVMSTADSMLIVTSTTLVQDFYHSFFNTTASKDRLLKISRRVTLLMGGIGLLIAILIPSIVQIIVNAFSTLIILLPAVLGGLLWQRATSKAAFWSICLGVLSTFILIPFLPKTAFIPASIVSILSFIVISLNSKHAESENQNLLQEIRKEMFGLK